MDENEPWDTTSNYSYLDPPLPDVSDRVCDFLDCLPCKTVDNDAFNAGISVLYAAAFVLGLVPNLAVLWLLATDHPPGARVSTALLPLSHTAACLCGISTLPALVVVTRHGVGHWPSGAGALCKLLFFTFELYQYGTALSVASMGVEQFSTFGSGTVARASMCAASWLLAVGASLPSLVVVTAAGGQRCEPDLDFESARTWEAAVGVLGVSLGCATAVVVFASFYIAARRDPAFDCSGRRELARVYFCLFLVCWLPYHTLLLAEALKSADFLTFNCVAAEGVFYGKQAAQCLAFLYSGATAWAFVVLKYARPARQADGTAQTALALS
ncbi:atypical chemokine receptor 3-like [Lampetra fluviatilis]